MKRVVLFLVILVLVMQVCRAGQAEEKKSPRPKSVKELTAELRGKTNVAERRKLLNSLRGVRPQNGEDVKILMNVVRSARGDEEKVAVDVLYRMKIEPEDRHLEPVFVEALDDPDRDIRTVAIVNLGTLKSKKAAPKLRTIVKGFSSLKFKALKLASREKADKMLLEAGRAAISLGQMKDEEAIPLLTDRLYDLRDYGSMALAEMGRKALPEVLRLARKEDDLEKAYARRALHAVKDKESEELLMRIAKNRSENPVVRDIVLNALLRNYDGQAVMAVFRDTYSQEDDSTRYTLVARSNRKKDIPFLLWVLKHEKDGSIREAAIISLEGIRDPSAIPALEEALKDRNKNIRDLSRHALKAIMGRDYGVQE